MLLQWGDIDWEETSRANSRLSERHYEAESTHATMLLPQLTWAADTNTTYNIWTGRMDSCRTFAPKEGQLFVLVRGKMYMHSMEYSVVITKRSTNIYFSAHLMDHWSMQAKTGRDKDTNERISKQACIKVEKLESNKINIFYNNCKMCSYRDDVISTGLSW